MRLHKYLALDKLQRVTTSSKVIPEIDGLRFLAISSVVLFHLRTHLMRTSTFDLSNDGFSRFIYDIISNGGFGVNIFFGISGFILAIPFAKQYLINGRKVNLRAYYIRRLTRLEPPYILIMTIFFFAGIILSNETAQSLLPHYFASLIYSHFFIYGEWSTINPVAWSLETEVQFYLLAPLLFLVFKAGGKWSRRAIIVFIILFFLFLSFSFLDVYIDLHLYKSLLIYLPYFGVGILFADFYLVNLQNRTITRSYFWDGIGIASTIAVFLLNPNDNEGFALISLAALFLLFVSTFKGKVLNHFYTRKFIYITGGMCYTIYLIHYGLIALVMDYTSKIGFNGSLLMNLLIQATLILPLLFLVSSFFFLLFEKPFMYKDWPKRFVNLIRQKASHREKYQAL